jgi:hypothetical protein
MAEHNRPDFAPTVGDVVFGVAHDDVAEETFTYVAQVIESDGLRFEILDNHGEAFIVERAEDRDGRLRGAVHDDGKRHAWRVAPKSD